jgi:cobalt-zinc-cadmium efflux system protein
MSHDHGHRHTPLGERSLDRRLWASAFLNVAITLAELIGGILSGSLALLSDAAHNLSDVMAVALALAARRFGRRPPTVRHTYGFRRAEIVAALANAVVLIAVGALIAREALVRLLHPEPVASAVMLVVASIALVANVGSMFLLHRHDESDVNVRSAYLHMAQDALASLAVVVAALLSRTSIGSWVDPAAALVVVIAVLRSGLSLVWETLSTLLEGVPEGISVEEILEEVHRAFPTISLHHLHVWQNGPGQRLLTAHVVVDECLDSRAIERLFVDLKALLGERWKVDHATLEPEVAGCDDRSLLGSWESRRSGRDPSAAALPGRPPKVGCGAGPGDEGVEEHRHEH